MRDYEVTEINEIDMIQFIGRKVSVSGRKEHSFWEGELSYHHPHFQIIDKDGERHNLIKCDFINMINGRSLLYYRFVPSQSF